MPGLLVCPGPQPATFLQVLEQTKITVFWCLRAMMCKNWYNATHSRPQVETTPRDKKIIYNVPEQSTCTTMYNWTLPTISQVSVCKGLWAMCAIELKYSITWGDTLSNYKRSRTDRRFSSSEDVPLMRFGLSLRFLNGSLTAGRRDRKPILGWRMGWPRAHLSKLIPDEIDTDAIWGSENKTLGGVSSSSSTEERIDRASAMTRFWKADRGNYSILEKKSKTRIYL